MGKIDDPLKLAANIIKYVTVYDVEQVPVSLVLVLSFI